MTVVLQCMSVDKRWGEIYDLRSSARYRNGIDRLIAHGLIQGDATLLYVTHSGYVVADDILAAAGEGESKGFMEYLDGLSGDELFKLAAAVCDQTQSIQCGRADPVAAILVSKGFLKKVSYDGPVKSEVPYTVPPHVWRYLNQNRDWLIHECVVRNKDRAERLAKFAETQS